jgi:hypothetical protein
MPLGAFHCCNPLEPIVAISDKWFLFPKNAFAVIVIM